MADKIHIGAIIATACKVDNGPEFLKHILDNFGAFDKIKLGRGLFSAINFKNTSVAELLLEYPDTNVDARNSYGHPPIWEAIHAGNTEIVKLLINAKCDLSYRSRKSNLDLLQVACMYDNFDIVKLLVDTGVFHRAHVCEHGMTALEHACGNFRDDQSKLAGDVCHPEQAPNRTKMCLLLMNNFWGLSFIREGINNPLHVAAKAGDLKSFEIFVEAYKIDIHIANLNGKTPLDLAKEHGHTDIVEYIEDVLAKESEERYVDVAYAELTPQYVAKWCEHYGYVFGKSI